jgi:hypothetical protein
MESLEKLKFVTSNFTQLKGLQMAVIGLLLVGTTLWADGHQGDLGVPILMMLAAAVLWFATERYYRSRFGKVRPTRSARHKEVISSVIFMFLGIGAFVLDTKSLVRFSFLGIVFAFGLLADYLRMNTSSWQRYLGFYPWFSLALMVVSLLPLVSPVDLWQRLGFNNAITGVMTVVSILITLAGILNHLFLAKTLPNLTEDDRDQAV